MSARRLFGFAPAVVALAMLVFVLIAAAQESGWDARERAAGAEAVLSSAFTYQGYLENGGLPANGTYEFTFKLFDAPSGCCAVGVEVISSGVIVSDGVFTVGLDFGAGAFQGAARWLEVCVDAGSSCETLSPRQPLTAAPYALSLRPGAIISGSLSTISGTLNLTGDRDALFIPAAGNNGILVDYAGLNGVRIESAAGDGLRVDSALDDGIDVAGSNLAGYFSGDVEITGSCTGCVLANFAVNVSKQPLRVGDVVALRGIRPGGGDVAPVLLEIGPAVDGETPVGVVIGGAELIATAEPRPGESAMRLVPRAADSVEPQGHLTIAFSGLVQVRAGSTDAPISAGDRLAAGDNGVARALQQRIIEGMTVSEGTAVVGVALEGVEAGQERLIWALIGLQ